MDRVRLMTSRRRLARLAEMAAAVAACRLQRRRALVVTWGGSRQWVLANHLSLLKSHVLRPPSPCSARMVWGMTRHSPPEAVAEVGLRLRRRVPATWEDLQARRPPRRRLELISASMQTQPCPWAAAGVAAAAELLHHRSALGIWEVRRGSSCLRRAAQVTVSTSAVRAAMVVESTTSLGRAMEALASPPRSGLFSSSPAMASSRTRLGQRSPARQQWGRTVTGVWVPPVASKAARAPVGPSQFLRRSRCVVVAAGAPWMARASLLRRHCSRPRAGLSPAGPALQRTWVPMILGARRPRRS